MRTALIIAAAGVVASPQGLFGFRSDDAPPRTSLVGSTNADEVEPSWLDDLENYLLILCDILGLDCGLAPPDTAEQQMERFRTKYWSVAPATPANNALARAEIEALWTHLSFAPEGVDPDAIRLTKTTLKSFYEDADGDPDTLP